MSTALLELKGISKTYPGARALRCVDFDLRRGEVHALLGENGAGKSTLIKVITGIEPADAGGSLRVDGAEISDPSPRLMQARGIAAVYQNPTLFDELSVMENLCIGEDGALVSWRRRRARARERLARVGATLDLDRPVRHLRMAEKQTIEIARALGQQARVLILDEPTASLAQPEADRLLDLVEKLRAEGTGILYISHRLEEVLRIADRFTILRDGALVGTHGRNDVDRARLLQAMAGRDFAELFPKEAVPIGEVILETRRLSCAAGGIRDISLTVRRGEILGLAGLVGSGRTEFARTLFGITPASGGEILIDGKAAVIRSVGDAVSRRLAYVPEDRKAHGVIEDLAVGENMTLASLRRLGGTWLDRAAEESLAAGLAQRLGVKAPSLFVPTRTLSGGNQQKVALARWLATEPRVLILDEPTQGIDVGAKAEIHRLMGRLARQGFAILLISSELAELLALADRIAVMRGGRLAGVLPAAEATRERVLHLALEDPRRVKSAKRECALGGAILLLSLLPLFGVPGFYRAGNLRNLAIDNLPLLVAATGMTIVIVAAEIDISVGSLFAVCGALAGLAAKAGWPMPLVVLATVGAGAALGAVNGLLVTGARVPSIIATLATMTILRNAIIRATGGAWIQDLPPGFQWFGLPQHSAQPIYIGAALALFLAAAWALRHTAAGRSFHAVGCNHDAARRIGLNPPRVILAAFVTMGALTAAAALLNFTRYPTIETNAGIGFELQVIAAVVVGGTAVTGGRGTLLGTLLGVVLLGMIGTVFTFLHVDPAWGKAIQGAIILAAVVGDTALGRKARHV